MPRPIALLGHSHACPLVDPGPKPHVGGPITNAGQSLVRFNGIPVAVEGGESLCTGVPTTDGLSKGSSLVRINGRGVMRVGDSTAHGGVITSGVPSFRAE